MLKGDEWRHLFRDVWVHKDVHDTREMRLDAVQLILGEEAFVCGATAAWIYGIDVQDPRGDFVWVGCHTGARLRTRTGCYVRELTVDDTDLTLINGVLVTTAVRTVFDCGRWLPLIEAVVVADALAHGGLLGQVELAAYVAEHRALRNVRRLDKIVELMDLRSESPMESRVRVSLVLAGLPIPETQIVIVDERGKFVARADMGYPEHKLLIEYDGAWHWAQRRDDDRRRDALRRLGWEVLVISAEDYYQARPAMIAKVREALARRAARRPA